MQINYANNVNIHIFVFIILISYYFTDKDQFTECILLHLFVNALPKGMVPGSQWKHHSFIVEILHVLATL